MLISSLISTAVALVGMASWSAVPSQNRESDFKSPNRSISDVREIASGSRMRSDDREARDACAGVLNPPSGCVAAGAADEMGNTRTFELSDGASQNGDAAKKMRSITLMSAAAPLLLSAIAGLAFAGGGRRYKR